ncbi:MAG: radical SAM protein [bacterium]
MNQNRWPECVRLCNKQKKRDSWFLNEYSINPYLGCPFNCAYCYSRSGKYSTQLNKKLTIKENAPELLEKALLRRVKKNQYGIIYFASQEAYPPLEKQTKLTRNLLEIVLKHKFPVHIGTKSTLVLRDLDILKQIDENAILPRDLRSKLGRGTIISFSFSTLNNKLAKIFEPGAPSPKDRLNVVKQCKKKGFLVGVNLLPVLPFLSDSEENLSEMIKTAKAYGADYVHVGGLTLFGEGKRYYYGILEKHFPDLLAKYKSLYRIFWAPPKEFQAQLTKKAKKLCKKHKVRMGII